jgi:hypothetical protein
MSDCETNITHPVSPEFRMENLTPEQALLLARLAKKADATCRAQVAAGEHIIEPFTVTVSGSLSVAPDGDRPMTTEVITLATLVVALHRAGIQREGIAAAIIDAAKVASANGGKVEGALSDTFDYVEGEVKALKERLKEELPRKPRKGSVRVKGRIE